MGALGGGLSLRFWGGLCLFLELELVLLLVVG